MTPMPVPTTRRVGGAVAALACALALGGCTGGDDDPQSKGEEGISVEAAAFVETFRAAYDGVDTAHVTMTVESPFTELSMEGDVNYSTDPPEVALTLDDGVTESPNQLLLVDGSMYFQEDDGTYLESDLDDPGNPLASLGVTDQLDPDAIADALEEGIDEVVDQGREKVDGEQLHRYDVTLDSEAIAGAVGKGELADAGRSMLPKKVDYTIWFDGEDRLRAFESDLGKELGSIRATFTKWGEPVDITAPPPGQVEQLELPQG